MFIGPSGQSPELTLNAEDDTQCYNGQNMLKLPGYMYAEHCRTYFTIAGPPLPANTRTFPPAVAGPPFADK